MKNEQKDSFNEDIPNLSGREVKFIRKEAGITAESIAIKFGRTKNFIYYYENFESVPSWFTCELMELVPVPIFNFARQQFSSNPEKFSTKKYRNDKNAE